MKKYFLSIALFSLAMVQFGFAQEKFDDMVAVGDELTIGRPSQSNYQFINIPRKNFIIKRGGIASLGSIMNKKVIITEINQDKNEVTQITFRTKNGSKFFKVYRTLSADLNKAISNGELQLKKATSKSEIAR